MSSLFQCNDDKLSSSRERINETINKKFYVTTCREFVNNVKPKMVRVR